MRQCQEYRIIVERGTESAGLGVLDEHLKQCRSCREQYRVIKRMEQLISDAFAPLTSAAEASKRIMAALPPRPAASAKTTDREPATGASLTIRLLPRRRVLVVNAAAVILLALVGTYWYFSDTVGLCSRAFAAAVNNMHQSAWVHWRRTTAEETVDCWFSPQSLVWAQKRSDGLLICGDLRARIQYRYSPEDGLVYFTVEAAEPGEPAPAPKSPFVITEQILAYLETEAAEATIEKVEQAGQITEFVEARMRQSSSLKRIELTISAGLPDRLVVDSKEAGESFAVLFDYPPDGPTDIYDLGAPAGAVVVSLEPPAEVGEMIARLNTLRGTALTSYVALSIPADNNAVASSFADYKPPAYFSAQDNLISAIWRRGEDRRHVMGYVDAEAYPEPSVEGLAEDVEVAADALVPVSIAIHKGREGRVYRYQLLGERAVRYSKQLSGASYGWDLFIEKIFWPHIAVPKDVFAQWEMQTAIGADDKPLVVLERTLATGASERWYLNPERDHICQKNEVLEDGEAVFSLEVLEYDQTAGGQWYPAVLEKIEFVGENGTGEGVALTRFIYLVERSGLPDELFDPGMLPEAEQID